MSSGRFARFAVSSIIAASTTAAFATNKLPFSSKLVDSTESHLAHPQFWPIKIAASSSDATSSSSLVERIVHKFTTGDYYVWLYRDSQGIPTSWEKYKVERNEDGIIIIEMSTKFSENEEYVTHHRMTVDLAENLEARDERVDWKLKIFEFRDTSTGKWSPFGVGENVQAFEEKFDIFSMIEDANLSRNSNSTPEFELDRKKTKTRPVKVNTKFSELVQTKRHEHTEAWFAPPDHELPGVAFLKNFKEHTFTLIESGREGEYRKKFNVSIS